MAQVNGTSDSGDLKECLQRFDREEISIPFPQRDVHLYQESV
jgi:small-conductance mechanosensitive channel